MGKKVVLVWFRNDLRLHDNEVLLEATQKADLVIPVYCFDPRYYSKNKFDNYNTGISRAAFIMETVAHLKQKLQALGSDLMTFTGLPEEILTKLCAKYEVDEVYHHREVATRETQISERVEAALWELKINLKHFIGHTLYHKEDLPFPIKDIPDKFNIFRKKIERESSVRKPFPSPSQISSPQHLESTSIPTLQELGFEDDLVRSHQNDDLAGGEAFGIEKLETLLDPNYPEFKNYSLISPYIASGALSPIYIFHRMYESNLAQNKKRFDRLLSSLLWRDYFRFMLKKYPNVFFKVNGVGNQKEQPEVNNEEILPLWKAGNTGEVQIDELIIHLKQQGTLTYAERRLLATYFVQEISSNWLEGASFFEENLLDFAPSTTYGFWSHMAGVGTSVKENNTFSWQDYAKKLAEQKG
ncbi:deoxyribodipyrimidine photo-lyase [Sphingobacterium sp. HJSM2_6]|uniref:deoxyribodipyrimidine photo-lyase n=1 Tax=Sphingobacterium sp. HJSM2_6 TaxID=3366264 RepID=UPI003BE263E3